jgi:hypothetical protein
MLQEMFRLYHSALSSTGKDAEKPILRHNKQGLPQCVAHQALRKSID